MTVNEYIRGNWKNSVRPGEPKGIPYPFNSPSCEQTSDVGFENFFYWDTYFINLGLLCDGMKEQALNNIKNMIFLIDGGITVRRSLYLFRCVTLIGRRAAI